MVGIDIVSIARIEAFIARFGVRGLKRFLHDEEIRLCRVKRDICARAGVESRAQNGLKDLAATRGELEEGVFAFSRVAGFWAAKEACSKALGVGIGAELGFHDMFITKAERGAPTLRLSQEKMRAFAIQELSLSISHDGGFAIAVVMRA